MMIKQKLKILSTTVVLGVCISRASTACRCVELSPEEYYSTSNYVYEGTVTNIEKVKSRLRDESGTAEFKIQVSVDKNWKNTLAKDVLTIKSVEGSFDCDFYKFRLQESYMFSHNELHLDNLVVGACSAISLDDKRIPSYREHFEAQQQPQLEK